MRISLKLLIDEGLNETALIVMVIDANVYLIY